MRVLSLLTAVLFSLPACAATPAPEPSGLGIVTQAHEERKSTREVPQQRIRKLAKTDASPSPAPQETDNPYADMAENSWRHVGPPISSVWADLDPPLDPLTRGASGLRAIVNQFCGAGWHAATKSFIRSCGGHRATGYNRAFRYDVAKLTIEWASPDVRLNHPDLTNACPYPSELGPQAGPAANHWYDGIVTTPDGNTYFFPEVAYDCKGLKNREPARVWRLSPEGEWSIAHDSLPSNVPATATEVLPDGKILTLSRYFKGIFDPAKGKYEQVDRYAELGGFGNLIAAGEAEPGVRRFLWFDYNQHLYQILVHKNGADDWSVGWPKKLADKVAWYTTGAVWLPEQQALMLWGGGQAAKFVLLDRDEAEIRVVKYPEIRDPGDRKFFIHDGGLQYLPDWGVVVALGPGAGEGIHVYRPPSDLRAGTEPAPPPPVDLQRIINAAKPGDVIRLKEPRYGPVLINKADLILECAPGTRIQGQRKSQGTLVLAAPGFTLRGCEVSAGHNTKNNASAVWGSHGSGGATFEGNTFHDSDNGILTAKGEAGTYVVRGNIFRKLGAGGRGHSYYDSSITSESILEGNTFEQPKGDGHLIKSRALRTVIRNNRLLGNTEEGQPSYSRLIDIPEGGHVVIENNEMLHGDPPGNDDAVCIGCEYNFHGDRRTTDQNSLVITGNKVRGNSVRFLHIHKAYPADILIDPAQIANDNEITGFEKIVSGR